MKTDALEAIFLPHSSQSILLCLQGTASPFQKETVSGLTHPLWGEEKSISINKITQMGAQPAMLSDLNLYCGLGGGRAFLSPSAALATTPLLPHSSHRTLHSPGVPSPLASLPCSLNLFSLPPHTHLSNPLPSSLQWLCICDMYL